MIHAMPTGELEVRRTSGGGVRLAGWFPYNSRAVISRGGRRGKPRKEKFAPGAFSYSLQDEEAEINLLVGHSFDKPLASKKNGTLTFDDTSESLNFEANLPEPVANTSHGSDTLALIDNGLAVGVSPGFSIPPERVAKDAESFEVEPNDPANGMNGAEIRTIHESLLYELSIVTRPAYDESSIEVQSRQWRDDSLVVRGRGIEKVWGYR